MAKLQNRDALLLLRLILMLSLVLPLAILGVSSAEAATIDVLQDGADRLVALQNNDGGWDWPLDDGNADSPSPLNTIGPIGKGLAQAYLQTHDSAHRASLQKVGSFLLTKTNYFSPPDGYLAAQLDQVFGGSSYRSFVRANYYDPLAAGTFDYKGEGTVYDTQGYLQLMHDRRAGIPNLAAWDLGMGLVGAASAGVTSTERAYWVAAVKAEIDELDDTRDSYAVLGLAGAVYGLAYVGENHDPLSGDYASADSLRDLTDILAAEPLASGGWDGELLQRNAYAILALTEFDSTAYASVIQGAAAYLESVQKPSGGWGGNEGENNEVTGEALWAITAAYTTIGAGAGGGCFIATSACGPDDGSVDTLRAFRDSHLGTDPAGSAFVSAYYRLSPPVAGFIDDHPALKPTVRALLLPAVSVTIATLEMPLLWKVVLVMFALSASSVMLVKVCRRGVVDRT